MMIATVQDLKAQAVILPIINDHCGRITDTAGDGFLAGFASVVNAVECACRRSETIAVWNADVSVKRRMQFRIGSSLGDVILDDAGVYGDGVNTAVRLKSITSPAAYACPLS